MQLEKCSETAHLCDPKADPCAVRMINYLQAVAGRGILSGQQNKSAAAEDLERIREITGCDPAIAGFDLMSYTAGGEKYTATADELQKNRGAAETALRLAKETGQIITFSWHWHSPVGDQRSHSFMSRFTDFDLQDTLLHRGKAYDLLLEDMDRISEPLQRFREAGIPVLWRPLHEADGTWFWWGKQGSAPYLELYHILYDRLTSRNGLHNLIWVWNGHRQDFYPGDGEVDISSIDTYAYKQTSGVLEKEYQQLDAVAEGKKPLALSEISVPPDPGRLSETGIPWLWFMLWFRYYDDEQFMSHESVRRIYRHPYTINREKLPDLYSRR